MESNQGQGANGLPGTGKTGVDSTGAGKLNRNMIEVFDQSLNAINDHVLNAEAAVRENTAQLRVMASTVELVRGIPEKMDAVEQALGSADSRVRACTEAMGNLHERVEAFEQSTVKSLGGRMDMLINQMQALAAKPAQWGAEMNALQVEMRRHADLFEKPQEKTVHHRHYLHYYGWIILGLGLTCGVFAFLWNGAREEADSHTGNDILWRGAMQIPDSAFHAGLMGLKYQCDTNSVEFRRTVEADEEHDLELARKLKEQNLKQQEADSKVREARERQQEADAEKQETEEFRKQKRKH